MIKGSEELIKRFSPYVTMAKLSAKVFAEKDWHCLTQDECDLVKLLVENEYLCETRNGFVGSAIGSPNRPVHTEPSEQS